MSQLQLALLGPPEVRHAGQVLTFRTRKAQALLIYLVVNKGMHGREKLTALLWPESEEESSRATLRSTLVYVRKALEEMRNPTRPHLLIEHDAIGFHFASDFELDLHILQTSYALTRTHVDSTEGKLAHKAPENVLIQLQHAVDVYRGDFLSGFSLHDAPDFEDWISTQREYWHRRMDAVCDRLSHMQFERGEMSAAIETITRWLSHDPFSELAYQRLIQVHFAAGDRTAALRAYDMCKDMLAKEFNVHPTPETEALTERIRVKNMPRKQRASTLQARSHSTPALTLEFPLVGRGKEHNRLVTLYHNVSRAGPQAVVLVGEAGIGKTRLATAFLDWAVAQGAEVLQGRAFEMGGRLPYQPLVEALRGRLAHEQEPGHLLSAFWLAELSRLLPELREYLPDLPLPTSDEATAPLHLLESIARLGQALAKQSPLVIFIDDVQWADASSLDVLRYVCRYWARNRTSILLLLSLRSEMLAITPELADWLSGLGSDLPLTHLELVSLTQKETIQLIHSLASRQLVEQAERPYAEQLGRWLYAETGGQPFFLLETLKMLVERGILAVQTTEEGTLFLDIAASHHREYMLPGVLPVGVRDMIRSRLAHLAPDAVLILTAGAVLGKSFTFEWLCQVANISEKEGLSALEALLVSHLLSEAEHERGTSGEERFLFAHDKIRDVVYTEAGSTRRRLLHRRALQTLQASSVSSAELAHHALAAGLTEAAIRWSLAAGDEALHLFAVRDAIEHYEQVQRLVTREGRNGLEEAQESIVIAPPALSHLYHQSGEAYEMNSQFAQAQRAYEELLTLARESNDAATECIALNHLATLLAIQGMTHEYPRMRHLLQQALSVAESSQNTAGKAETLWNLAQTSFFSGRRMADTLSYAEQALIFARELGMSELIGRCLHILATVESALGKWENSLPHAQEGRDLYVTLGNRQKEAACLGLISTAYTMDGQHQQGIALARAALSIRTEIDNPFQQTQGRLELGIGLLESGAYTEALTTLQQGVAIARAIESKPLMVIMLNEVGNAYRAMYALEATRLAHSEALSISEQAMLAWVGRIAGELSADYALAGQWEQASLYAIKAITSRDPTNIYGGLARWHEIEALLRGGYVEQAREEVRRYGELTRGKRRYRIAYLRALAVLARWDQEIDQAITHLEAACALAQQLDLPGELWQILTVLGELYQSSANTSLAQQAYIHAARLIRLLADRMGDEQQRATFLSAQQVSTVLKHDIPARRPDFFPM